MTGLEDPAAAARASPSPTAADYIRLFNLSLDLLCIAGLDGYFRKVNPAWTRVMGWSEDELLARPIAFFMHPDDRERTLAARADLAKGVVVQGLENRYLCKDGSYRWLAWQSSVEIADATVFAVARDITERRQRDHERLVLGKLESTGILAGGIAHDFNNLLGELLLNLDMIDLSGPNRPDQQEYLQRARESVRAAESLTNQLLTFAKGGEAARRLCQVEPLVRESSELALSGSNIAADCRVGPDVWPVDVDEAQVRQVIRNVVLNAREAMPLGGTVCVHAVNVPRDPGHGAGTPSGDSVRITVTDSGAGIAPDVLPRVFDPYFSTKPRGTQKGMGLGLTICRTVVQKHGGTIVIDSQPSVGTKVTINLPAARITVSPTSAAATPPAAGTGKKRILVMDDEPLFRQVLGEAMRRHGYGVELAADGDEAIALCEKADQSGCPFDAVLLDLTVRGGMGGAEAMKVIRQRSATIRGVLMTGYSNDRTFREYAQHGFSAALGKPFSADALHATLVQVLQLTG